MTKCEELFCAIGEIDDKLIIRSEKVRKGFKKTGMVHSAWIYGGALAAAACLLLVISGVGGSGNLRDVTPIPLESSSGVGGNGPDHPSDYVPGSTDWLETDDSHKEAYGMATELEWVDFNAGPIMPITFAQENRNITASRELTYDFGDVEKADKGYVPVKDAYVLNNTSGQEQTVTYYYPYVTDIQELSLHMPKVYVDGQEKELNVSGGVYWGTDSYGMAKMFSPYVSTDEYCYMTGDMKPVEDMLQEELLNQTVIVYEFENLDSGNVSGEAGMYSASFKVTDPNKVFMSDMFDMTYDGDCVKVSFALNQSEGQKPAIYFMDGEPTEYEEQGYCYTDMTEANRSDEVTAKRNKYETTMKDVLMDMVTERMQSVDKETGANDELSSLYYNRAAKMFCVMYCWKNDGVITPEDDIFYAACISDIAYMVWDYESLYILSDTITIPAGESVTLDLEYVKQGAHQTYEPQEELRDHYCYDNMPNLGTNVKFTSQKAAIEESGNIRIKDQNYGFDLEKGVKAVELALDAERYYMIVKILK